MGSEPDIGASPGIEAPANCFHVIEQPWRTFEDLQLDQSFACGGFTFSRSEIIGFARRFDPQGFHVDERLARESIVGQLFASSIHTLAASVGIFVRATRLLEIAVGLELRAVELPRPALADTPYFVTGRWVFARHSNSRPGLGIVRWEAETRTETSELVMRFGSTIMVRRTDAAEPQRR